MNIEIYGAKFVNKGAELMLEAIIQKIKSRYPSANIVLACSNRKDWDVLSSKGFGKRLSYRKYKFSISDLGIFIPKVIRRRYNIILKSEIDVVFEASGFAYGDQWTYRLAKFMSKYVTSWKKNGAKVIFLPQAMGPFNKALNAKFTAEFIEEADYVFVRDKISFEHVKGLNVNNKKIILKPDFTILLDGKASALYDSYKDAVCLIPNNKVISSSKDLNMEVSYLELFSSVVSHFKSLNKKVFLLNHEGIKDQELAKKIQDRFPELDIVWEKDPLIIKYVIGNSYAVVGSRFHGLVSSLSQGIPSLAIGWSHKYEMLFEDFGFKDGVIRVNLSEDELTEKLKFISAGESRENVKSSIIENGKKLKQEAAEMWQTIFEYI